MIIGIDHWGLALMLWGGSPSRWATKGPTPRFIACLGARGLLLRWLLTTAIWLPFQAASILVVVHHPPGVAVVPIHALGHDPGAQPKAQNEVFQRRDAFDLML